jgi:allantoicase
MSEPVAVGFTGLVDLAAAALGGRVVGASDDFFAAADNLLQAGRGVFIEGKYTDRGKWMDGWESRRRRAPMPGVGGAAAAAGANQVDCDWCILELGAAGEIRGLDIDTNHFLGNHPPFASVEGSFAPRGTPLDALLAGAWVELLAQTPLRPGAQNLFAAIPRGAISHVRLNIFPDGGVARLRVFGRVSPPAAWDTADADAETRGRVAPDRVDLAAVKNGGLALACSDAFFGPMNNLLLPGRSIDMSGGWETRRRRGPGYDWILIKLGAPGAIDVVEVDTNHFKGNYPDRCALETIHAPDARITDLIASDGWSTVLPESKLQAHARHFFELPRQTPAGTAPATHVRLNIFPDGGVSRLRLWGRRHA